ncbi:MAG: HU family DNA-binding protein [Litoreibacter sp.]
MTLTPKSKPKSTRTQTKAKTASARTTSKSADPIANPKVGVQIDAAANEDIRNEVSKKELIERVAERMGAKKSDARLSLDTVLSVLGDALAEGANISAAPLGKIKVTRSKETANGTMVVCRVKLKQNKTDTEGSAI